jgi:hypothetical protein
MTTTIEQELGRTIEAEARRITEAGPNFFAAVAARTAQRRRRQRRGAAAALAVAVVTGVGVAAGAAAVLPDRHDPTAETTPTTTPSSTEPSPPAAVGPDQIPNFAKAADVAKVWPAAVTTLPGRLPTGAPYVVQAVLPDGRYLVLEWRLEGPGFTLEHPSIFEPAANSVRRLTDPSAVVGFTVAGVSGDNAVWVTSDPVTFAHEIWAAPLAGGPARKLIRLPNQTPDMVSAYEFTLVGDSVMWHAERVVVREGSKVGEPLGIFRIPIAGGAVKSVPNTVGFQFTRDFSGFGGVVALAYRGNELLDLATGQRMTWTRAAGGVEMWPIVSCAFVGCIGSSSLGGIGPIVWRPDGSGLLKLENGTLSPLGDGRFLSYWYAPAGTREPSLVVWDRATGRAAVCSRERAADARPLPGTDFHLGRSFLTWQSGDALMLFDLTKIT